MVCISVLHEDQQIGDMKKCERDGETTACGKEKRCDIDVLILK